MEKSNLDSLLDTLQLQVVNSLISRIQKGEATAADLAVARQLLKDNNKVIDIQKKNLQPLRKLGSLMPFQDPELPIAANE